MHRLGSPGTFSAAVTCRESMSSDDAAFTDEVYQKTVLTNVTVPRCTLALSLKTGGSYEIFYFR